MKKPKKARRASKLVQTWISDEEMEFVTKQATSRNMTTYSYLRELIRSEMWVQSVAVMREELQAV